MHEFVVGDDVSACDGRSDTSLHVFSFDCSVLNHARARQFIFAQLTHSLSQSLTPSLTHSSLIHYLAYALTHALTHSSTNALTQLFVDSPNHSPTLSLTHTHTHTHSLTHRLTHRLLTSIKWNNLVGVHRFRRILERTFPTSIRASSLLAKILNSINNGYVIV